MAKKRTATAAIPRYDLRRSDAYPPHVALSQRLLAADIDCAHCVAEGRTPPRKGRWIQGDPPAALCYYHSQTEFRELRRLPSDVQAIEMNTLRGVQQRG
jgi:hypothetical protein